MRATLRLVKTTSACPWRIRTSDGDGNFSVATDMVIEIAGLPTLDPSDFDFIP